MEIACLLQSIIQVQKAFRKIKHVQSKIVIKEFVFITLFYEFKVILGRIISASSLSVKPLAPPPFNSSLMSDFLSLELNLDTYIYANGFENNKRHKSFKSIKPSKNRLIYALQISVTYRICADSKLICKLTPRLLMLISGFISHSEHTSLDQGRWQ